MADWHFSNQTRLGMAALSIIAALTMSGLGVAQTGPEAEVLALQQEWIAAEVAADTTALERVLDERFVATYPSGRTVDRSAFIDTVVAANLAPFQVSTERIDIHGDTAVVIDLSEDGATKFVWVAIKRDGIWRAISESFHHIVAAQR